MSDYTVVIFIAVCAAAVITAVALITRGVSSAVITHHDKLPMNIGNIWERALTFCGLSILAVLEIFEKDGWFDQKAVDDYEFEGVRYKGRAILITCENGVDFSCTKVPVGTEGSIRIRAFSKEERKAIDINTPMTNELLAAMMFSALGNGGVMRLMKADFVKNGLPSSKTDCIAMAHLLWATGQWDVDCLKKDPVCKAVSDLTGLTLTTEMFKGFNMPKEHDYYVALLDLIATPPADLQETFELDWIRFCTNAKALGYTIEF
jgi:hypothetical protein